MTYARRHHDLVLLPDQTVLAVGGSIGIHTIGSAQCRVAEIFDPNDQTNNVNGSWRPDPSTVKMEQPRGYHSTALLLPDARVLVAGGEPGPDEPDPPNPDIVLRPWTAQIYRPPYLDGDPPRVVITEWPARMVYGAPYQIKCVMAGISDYEVKRVCLIKLGAVTHGFDHDQRYVPLKITHEATFEPDPQGESGHTGRIITVEMAPTAAFAPPGPYMLWMLTEAESQPFVGVHVPCLEARHVLVGNERVLVQSGQINIINGNHTFQPVQAHGSVWNPDHRSFHIRSLPLGGKVVVELGSEVAATSPVAQIMFRLISRVDMDSPLSVKIDYYNWTTSSWKAVFDGPMAPSANRLIWAVLQEDQDPSEYLDANARLKVRVEWSGLPTWQQGHIATVRIVEATWLLVPEP